MIPEILDFRITSKCNMNCPFCFGTKMNDNLDEKKLFSVFSFLREHGVKYVVLTGGEPSLSDDLFGIISMLEQLDYKIAISSNGTFWSYPRIRNLILNKCSCIALPVESTVPSEHNYMRKSLLDHHKSIYSILPQIRNMAPNIKIKIGTVVTKENIKNISGILESLPIEPDTWKLFQLSQTMYNFDYYKKHRVEDHEFDELIQKIRNKYKDSKTRIICSHESSRNGGYIFMESNGNIMVINNDKECVIGNYGDKGNELIARIERYVDADRTNSNFYNSFGIDETVKMNKE